MSLIGNTHRLGNLIDAWFFGSLGSQERIKEFTFLNHASSENSFGRFLKLNPDFKTLIDDSLREDLVEESEKFWASYFYHNIIKIRDIYQEKLTLNMKNYAETCRNELIDKSITKYDCVVHYRLGDFVKLGLCISPQSVAMACYQHPNSSHFKNIGIIDGGVMWNNGYPFEQSILDKSILLQAKLINHLKSFFPKSTIELFGNDTDLDFWICANAPSLVTAGGSFSITAAIANKKGVISTPACYNLNFPKLGEIHPQNITPNWYTYSYDVLKD